MALKSQKQSEHVTDAVEACSRSDRCSQIDQNTLLMPHPLFHKTSTHLPNELTTESLKFDHRSSGGSSEDTTLPCDTIQHGIETSTSAHNVDLLRNLTSSVQLMNSSKSKNISSAGKSVLQARLLDANTLKTVHMDFKNLYTDEQKIRDGKSLAISELSLEGPEALEKGVIPQEKCESKSQQLLERERENAKLKIEVMECHERELRLKRECDRLRAHLLETEDRYTREALEAEEREEHLQVSLASLREEMISSNTDVLNTKSSAAKQVESLRSQLNSMMEQRDEALQKLAAADETVSSYSCSLANLQMVLEQFQDERQHHQLMELERYQRDLEKERLTNRHLQGQMDRMQEKLDELSSALSSVQPLKQEVKENEKQMSLLHTKIQEQEEELSKANASLQRFSAISEDKIDRLLAKNLLLGFIHTPPAKREEAFRVVGRILDFSDDELNSIGVNSSGSWISGLFLNASPAGVGKSAKLKVMDHSFFELFVQFLEKESTPPPQAKLPAEKMAQEQQERQQRVACLLPPDFPLTNYHFPPPPQHQSASTDGFQTSSHSSFTPDHSSQQMNFPENSGKCDMTSS